ncbi:hypothetical protein ACHAWF_002768 [Thalassiosira exigua]
MGVRLDRFIVAILSFLAAAPPTAVAFGFGGVGAGVPRRRRLPSRPQRIAKILLGGSDLSSQSSEFGAISASSAPPRLSPTLIEEALARLPWEEEEDDDADDEAAAEDVASGKRWYKTREMLTKLWILPRDMSNGSWEAYAAAADAGEDKMLSSVPQLLRLPTIKVKASAKTALGVLDLPPALLRREPLLLTVPPDLLSRGFDDVILAQAASLECGIESDVFRVECTIESIKKAACEACRDTPGLLLEAATKPTE